MKRCLVISVALCLLSGCTVPFFVGSAVGGALGGCVAADRRSLDTIADDRNIHYQADLRLKSSSRLKKCRLVVAVFNHVVLLTGEAPTQEQRYLAEQIIRAIPRVKHVYNKIEIGLPLSPRAQSEDAWITTKVISSMVRCTDLNTVHVKVVTEARTVYLMGIVTAHQAYAAGEIARRVEGVKKVVKLFEYASIPR